MNNYFEKYKKYKSKYLNLLKKINQIGGNQQLIEINLDNYKDLYRRFIYELNYEMSFSVDIDPNNEHLISEFIKGKPFVDEDKETDDDKLSGIDIKMDLFNKTIHITHINCHTHDKYSADKLGYRYAPPSASDFVYFIEKYCKNYTNKYLIFTHEGIYEISLASILIEQLISEPLYYMTFQNLPISRRYKGYRSFPEWDDFIHEIRLKTENAQILLSRPRTLNPEQFEKIRKSHMEDYNQPMINTMEEYLEYIRSIGFNIKLYSWEESLDINIIINKNVEKFLLSAIKAKQQEFLLDILLINPYDNLEDEDLFNNELNENNYIDLNDKSNEELFNIII